MAISPLPTPPASWDKQNFRQRADNFVAALPKFVTEANALAEDVNEKYVKVMNQAVDGGYSQHYLDTQYNPPMARTYYVDAVNGDDANDGSSGSPFKTIKKACDSVPVGGYGEIHVIGQYRQADIGATEVYLYKKTILIILHDEIVFDFVQRGSYIGLSLNFIAIDSSLSFILDDDNGSNVKVNISDNTLSGTLQPTWSSVLSSRPYNGCSSLSFMLRNRADNNTMLYIGKDTKLLNLDFWSVDSAGYASLNISGHYPGSGREIVAHTQSKLLVANDGNVGLYINYLGGYKDQNGNSETATQFATSRTAGIIKDADGKPRNIISNIVL